MSTNKLLLIQIDGLARKQLEKAIDSGKMPFLRRLQHGGYDVHSFYSGLPSSTPAVQGELFYGEKCIVPSFGYRSSNDGKECSMIKKKCADFIESKLKALGSPLLLNGSSYSNTYRGGAQQASFCVSNFGIEQHLDKSKLLYILKDAIILFFRIIFLFTLEVIISIIDLIHGLVIRQSAKMEFNFIPARLAICILIRELIVFNVVTDIRKKTPIIHCNLLGYDEHAHRRGPDSKFAHWTLPGIDKAIRRMFIAARECSKEPYTILIYSDHGQERVNAYQSEYGITIQDAVLQVATKIDSQLVKIVNPNKQCMNSQSIEQFKLTSKKIKKNLMVIAVGPVGHIYLSESYSNEWIVEFMQNLIHDAHIPAVATILPKTEQIIAYTKEGKFYLPEHTTEIVGKDHPFLESIKEDLVKLIKHQDAGDIVFFGWKPQATPLSFPPENGAHAGPGRTETHGFLMIPNTFGSPGVKTPYFRPMDLRKSVLNFIENGSQIPMVRSLHKSKIYKGKFLTQRLPATLRKRHSAN